METIWIIICCLEDDWINFKWVDINELDNYKIHPKSIIQLVNNNNIIYHVVEENTVFCVKNINKRKS